jgi:hypothetical protein
MAKVDYKVRELVGKIRQGELQLPEMQRRYVWTSTKVRDLLDSLYRGYPSGVILTWQAAEKVVTQEFAIEATKDSGGPTLLLLDGQQRLTSLSAVLRGELVTVRNRKRPVEILFNLDHPDALTFITEVDNGTENDEDADDADDADSDLLTRVNRRAFVVASNQVAAQPNWVRVSDVFKKTDAELLQGAGVTGFGDPNYQKYSERLKALRGIADYEYRVDILEPSKSYEEVTEIFVRVNSLGAKLRSSDLALAQITAKWNGSLALFNDYRADISKHGFDLDLGIYLKTLVSLVTGQSKFLTVGSLTRPQLEDGWERCKRALDFTINFVKENLDIDSPTLLSSPFLLVTAAYWADQRDYKISDEDCASFRQWFLIANAKGRYSRGSSETLLDQDLATLRAGGDANALPTQLLRQVGRLDFTAADLIGRTSRSGVFKTMFLLFRARKAADWASNLQISPKVHGAADKIEFHHVFPKAFMAKKRPDLDARLIDDISNMAFISAKTNKEIRDRSPEDYAGDYPAARLEAQLVTFEHGVGVPEQFEGFCEHRREAIATALNSFLGLPEA